MGSIFITHTHAKSVNKINFDITSNLIQFYFFCLYIRTTEEIMTTLNLLVDENAEKNVVNVSRYNIMSGTLRAFNWHKFNEFALPSVKFMGEAGIDEGGPTREWMTLLMDKIREAEIFVGPKDSRMLTVNVGGMQNCFLFSNLFTENHVACIRVKYRPTGRVNCKSYTVISPGRDLAKYTITL